MTLRILSALFLSILTAHAAEDAKPAAKPYTPEPANLPADLSKQGPDDEKYPLPQDPAKQKALRDARQVWFRKQVLDSFEKHRKAEPRGLEKARAALTDYADYANRRVITDRLFAEQQSLRIALLNASNLYEDPILSGAVNLGADNRIDTIESLLNGLEGRDDCDFLKLQLAVAQVKRDLQAGDADARRKAMDRLDTMIPMVGRMAGDRTPAAESQIFQFADTVQQLYVAARGERKVVFEKLKLAFQLNKSPESRLKLLEAQYWYASAWNARGDVFADSVTQDGAKVFKERLEKAQACAEEAWKASSECAGAAVVMIQVATGVGHDRETMEKWFRRAMEADPDCNAACHAKHWYLLPRWHGSPDGSEGIRFARQCFRANNDFAQLGFYAVLAHYRSKRSAIGLPELVTKYPEVWADCRAYYERQLQLQPKDAMSAIEYIRICETREEWAAMGRLLEIVKPYSRFPGLFPKNLKQYDALKKLVDENLNDK